MCSDARCEGTHPVGDVVPMHVGRLGLMRF